MQVGPNPAATPPMSVPPELEEQRARTAASAANRGARPASRLVECLRLTAEDGEAAYDSASSWRANARDAERSQAAHCQGLALVRMERYAEARDIFAVARGEVGDDNPTYRARLGAMAGNAAMAGRQAGAAIPHFERAIADASSAGQEDIATVHDGVTTDQVHGARHRKQGNVFGQDFSGVLGAYETGLEHGKACRHPHH
jgi:hypothetical protein